jgi:hypothetical protein
MYVPTTTTKIARFDQSPYDTEGEQPIKLATRPSCEVATNTDYLLGRYLK